jgi:GAF domain-containing protein
MLLEMSTLLQDSLAGGESLGPLFQLLKRVVPYQSATLYQVDSSSGRLVCRDRVGEQLIDLIDVVRFDLGFGLSAWIAKQRRPVVIPNLRRRTGHDQHDLRSFIGLPLTVGEELVGVLNFGHSRPDAFLDVEADLLQILGNQIALLLRNLDLVARLRAGNRELRERNERLRQMQARLVESERIKAVADLVAAMNHEINNPLTIISGQAELLGLHLGDRDALAAGKLEIIAQQVRRLGRVLSLLASLRHTTSAPYPGGLSMLDLAAEARQLPVSSGPDASGA